MSDDVIKRIQNEELKILEEFKRICKKYDLTYYAIGGSCLGAVRHQGFIPWDDDIDVAMPYNDYCTLRKVAANELKQPYELYDFDEHQHCHHRFLKIHNTDTTFIEDGGEEYPDRWTGVYIDIMPLYGVPADEQEKNRMISKYHSLSRKNDVRRFKLKDQVSLARRILWFPMLLVRPFTKYNDYSRRIENMLSEYPMDSSSKIMFGWRGKVKGFLFDYKDYEKAVEMPFENTTISVPIGYDGYLKTEFGDYMQLPPKEKQVSVHPTAKIDLDKSYKEYK